MAFGLDDQKTTPVLLLLLAGLVGYMAWSGAGLSLLGVGGLGTQREQVQAVQDSIAALQAANDSAKRELARGSIEELRQRMEVYRADLALLEELVPQRNEVPNLLDDISTRAKLRGVNLALVTPQAVEQGPEPFDTHRYQLSVIGHYDQVGEFLADIASLRRVIVPFDISMAIANAQAAKALGDTTGALLEAKFQIRTYVKATVGAAEDAGAN